MNSQQELLDAISTLNKNKDRSYDTPATVLRVDGDTVWVHIDGGADETPVARTINCEQGETVQVRISNGSAFLVGNASAPPTDDKRANAAHFIAQEAAVEATAANVTAVAAREVAAQAQAAVAQSLTVYETWYILSATEPTQPTEDSHTGWSTTEPAWSSSSTDTLYYSIRTVKGDGSITWSAVGTVQSYADLVILKNAVISTVQADYVGQGTSGVTSLSSTMYQNVNGVNIFNNTLAVGDSYAHIDGNSFDIKKATTAGAIDDTNDTMVASFGQEITVGSRLSGSTVGTKSQVYGYECTASGQYSHASGAQTIASGQYSHATGAFTEASGHYSYAEGNDTESSGTGSHSEGQETTASGNYSHSEGEETTASSTGSHAEGLQTTASGAYSHSEGYKTTASKNSAHAEGGQTTASEDFSHAEGEETTASGLDSHSEGYKTVAYGSYSHAQNKGTKASSNSQTAIGKYNIDDTSDTYALIVGNGSGDSSRSNAFSIDWSGNVMAAGNITIPAGNVKDVNGNNKTPTILTSTTISASTTSYTFSNSAIKTDSVLDLYDTIFGFTPTNMTVSNGSCTVTFPAQSSSHTLKLFVY